MIHEVFPYLHVSDAAAAIAFYCKVFGAREKLGLNEPSGRIGHAELDFDGTTVMLSDEFPEYGIKSATTIGSTSETVHLHVDNVDQVIQVAAIAGASIETACQDQFYGERSGVIRDPFGHRWNIGHSIEDVSAEEMQRRYSKMFENPD